MILAPFLALRVIAYHPLAKISYSCPFVPFVDQSSCRSGFRETVSGHFLKISVTRVRP